jgi:hypothetical protein
MIRKQEIYARQLYEELQSKFLRKRSIISKIFNRRKTDGQTEINISIAGAGVHWHCLISKGSRQCKIHCFEFFRKNSNYKGPEFYTIYFNNDLNVAAGRTPEKENTIKAIRSWLQNDSIDEMYSQYDFIDKNKRQLEHLKNIIIKSIPEIFRTLVVDSFKETLLFKDAQRSCRVHSGYETNAKYTFYWDDCNLFETYGSVSRLIPFIRKWVIDKDKPSVLKLEFPEIEFGKLPEYYENGNGIEGEFILSWDNIELFYERLGISNKDEIFEFIRTMRKKGFEKTLRAGQSIYFLILSRSRRHGLRADQNRIVFHFTNSGMSLQVSDGQKLNFDKIEYNSTLDKLLRELEQETIN